MNSIETDMIDADDLDPSPYADRYCAICGEREESVYANHCCTDDQMLEA